MFQQSVFHQYLLLCTDIYLLFRDQPGVLNPSHLGGSSGGVGYPLSGQDSCLPGGGGSKPSARDTSHSSSSSTSGAHYLHLRNSDLSNYSNDPSYELYDPPSPAPQDSEGRRERENQVCRGLNISSPSSHITIYPCDSCTGGRETVEKSDINMYGIITPREG